MFRAIAAVYFVTVFSDEDATHAPNKKENTTLKMSTKQKSHPIAINELDSFSAEL